MEVATHICVFIARNWLMLWTKGGRYKLINFVCGLQIRLCYVIDLFRASTVKN